MTEDRDHYQVLGVDPSASAEEIRAAHRRLVRVLHPDRHAQASAGERALADRRMREINDAWNTLRDASRRSSYDLQRRSDQPGSGGRTRSSSPGRSESAPSRSRTQPRPAGTRPKGSTSRPRPGSSTAGQGAYWHASARPSSGATDADPLDDGIQVRAGTAHLLRKGPIAVIIIVVVGLFVVTAYAGGKGESDPVQPAPLEGCARVYEGSNAIVVPCDVPNDGRIVAQVQAALDCPDRASRYVSVGTEFFCISESATG